MTKVQGLVLALSLCAAVPARAATYTYTFIVDQWCGEADNNGKPNATDSLVALNASVGTSLTGNQCKMSAGDDETSETYIRAVPHADGSRKEQGAHGVRLEPKDDCGGGNAVDSAANANIAASDSLMILNLATGLDNTDGNDCQMEVIDDCPQSGQSGYGAAQESCIINLDNPVASPSADGVASCAFVRKTLDVCDDFDGTNEATCESTTNDRNQYCTWTASPSFICRGTSATHRRCLTYQKAAGIDVP